ncbi:Asp-tRNA(Asn)/Glu-tRNA(Gln) amidotransferase subunit GatA [Candidatus Kuenenbacteria bacterium]|nr:Asp-tRNA(Asn)/Glu-tRNA(Gln) amidotransferase subunit GatA [Candidatus Kuenenbacteria bacterium]
MSDLSKLTIEQAHLGLKNKEFSSVDLVKNCLDQIGSIDHRLKAFVNIFPDHALSTAEKIDESLARGDELHPLAGIPYAAKDIFCTEGLLTTASSKILEKYVPPFESTTTERLKKTGAVLVGKTNLDEFAMGASTENSAFFPTQNPHDETRVPGGSSGGSAAAVAADEVVYALGTDTGGSVRQPASFCGVVGLKPTYGRTSRYGVIAMASSLDTISHFTKTVADAALVLQTIAGRDDYDSTTANEPLDNYYEEIKKPAAGLRIGLPEEYFETEGVAPQVKEVILSAVKKIEELVGSKVVPVKLTPPDYALACYYLIMPSEVSSNLARYDGVKYGLSTPGKDLLDTYLKTRGAGLGAEAKRRIILGTFALSHGYYDAYYKKACAVRALIKKDFEKAFESVDLILAPTSPTIAFKLGERSADPLQMYLADLFTIPMSLAGVPTISVPTGLSDGLPVGLQIIGKWFDEKTVLRLAHHFEQSQK